MRRSTVWQMRVKRVAAMAIRPYMVPALKQEFLSSGSITAREQPPAPSRRRLVDLI
jgi:hypothetical protein